MTIPTPIAQKVVVEKLHKLGLEIADLNDTDNWRAWLHTTARFSHLSFYNTLLVYAQRPHATEVMTYDAWAKLGRQVNEKEKALRILEPMTYRNRETGESEIRGFKLAPRFDYAQTRPERRITKLDRKTGELRVVFEGEPYVRPEWPMVPESEIGSLFVPMVGACAAHDITVEVTAERHGDARGWCIPKDKAVWIRNDLQPTQALATLLHELGHLHDPEIADDTDRARKEHVAESVAYLAADSLGIDKHASSLFYLGTWRASDEGLVALGKRVTASWRQVHRLIDSAAILAGEAKAA